MDSSFLCRRRAFIPNIVVWERLLQKIILMFKKAQRLSTNFQFNITKKYGTRIHGEYFSLVYLKPKNYVGSFKIGIIVSNKFDKRATVRNRIKRLFREAIRKNMSLLKNDIWMIFIPKYFNTKVSYEKISADINKVLSKIFVA